VVVIGIIMALAGILTVTLPDLFSSANNATMVTNLKEIDNTVQTWGNTHRGVCPNRWDSLLTASGDLYSYLPAVTGKTPVGGYLTSKALTAQHVARLRRAGITLVCNMVYNGTPTGTRNATLNAGDAANPVTLAEATKLAFVTSSGTAPNETYPFASLPGNKMQFENGHQYVVFGVGRGTDLVGANGLIKDQPVIIHSQGCTSAVAAYCAPCAIFDLGIPTASGRDTIVAQYVGSVALSDGLFRFSEEMTSIY